VCDDMKGCLSLYSELDGLDASQVFLNRWIGVDSYNCCAVQAWAARRDGDKGAVPSLDGWICSSGL
jgi:hypothetical protein